MTASDAAHLAPADASPLEDALLSLIDLVERRLDDGADEVRALRRAVAGRYRAQDETLLASRFQASRLCLLGGPRLDTRAVAAEVRGTPGAIVDVRLDEVVVLVPGLPRHASTSAEERLARVIARIHGVAPRTAVGVSTALDGVAQAARGLDEASRALARCQPGRAVLADDAWFDIALSRMRDSLRESLVAGGPLALLDDPLRSGGDLRTSLVAWLAADGDTRAAAERLHLHPNTLRYRLRRAADITGMDLDDPLQRLVAHLALTTAPTVA